MCCIVLLLLVTMAGAQQAPQYRYDATWPKLPLPNKWTFGGVTGLTVDSRDVIWVLHRPEDLDETENYATLNPPRADCCVKAPEVLAFDMQGNLVHSWNAQPGHMLLVDRKGQVWIGSDTFRIFSQDGKLIAEFPRAPELARTVRAGNGEGEGRPGGGAARQGGPGRQGGGEGAGRGRQGGGDGQAAGRGQPQAPPYPADIELIAGGIEGAEFDEGAREVYVTDNYLGGRVLVFDMDTFKFKRGWGAYGKPLKDISTQPRPPLVDPKAPPNKDFVSHVTIAVSRDGVVYAADRRSNRIQTFTKQGKYLAEYFVAPETLDRGSTGGMAFSQDRDQRYLFVSDIMQNCVWILNRKDMKPIGRFGFSGHNGGGFHWLHMIATDSKGNIYTGEVDSGKRVQKFVLN
jgi:hypothetical protein